MGVQDKDEIVEVGLELRGQCLDQEVRVCLFDAFSCLLSSRSRNNEPSFFFEDAGDNTRD